MTRAVQQMIRGSPRILLEMSTQWLTKLARMSFIDAGFDASKDVQFLSQERNWKCHNHHHPFSTALHVSPRCDRRTSSLSSDAGFVDAVYGQTLTIRRNSLVAR
jgi:hypothetical protein